MKKFLLFLLAIFIMPVFAGAFDLRQDSKEQKQLAQELNNLKQDTCDLYGVVEEELLNYYGKNNIRDFYDPEHKTGWFRVYDFLTWFKENEQTITEKLIKETDIYNYTSYQQHLKNPLQKYCSQMTQEFKGFLGFFLGKEYLLSKYINNKDLTYDYIPIERTDKLSGYANYKWYKIDFSNLNVKIADLPCNTIYCKSFVIGFNTDAHRSFIGYINIGLHEAMHIAGLYTFASKDILSEMFSIYAQLAYGLPANEGDFASGTRNLYNIVHKFPDNTVNAEYKHSLFAYIQFKDLCDMSLKEGIVPVSEYIELYNSDESDSSGRDFFEPLLTLKPTGPLLNVMELVETPVLDVDANLFFVKNKNSSISLYYRGKEHAYLAPIVKEREDGSNDIYLRECTIEPASIKAIKEHVGSFFIMKKYVGTFELLAIKYVNMAMDALEREDYEKFVDIKQNPLKYVLKENKDVPPVPEGYI